MNPFDVEMEWYSTSASPDDCSTADKHDIDIALFEGSNTVLNTEGYDEYDNLVDDRRRNLRTLQDCSAFCVRACAYNQHLCVMVYSCDCRRRVLIEGEMASRELQMTGLITKFQDMCTATLAAKSIDAGISDPCKTALLSSSCAVALTAPGNGVNP